MTAINPVGTFAQPDYETMADTAETYPLAIDNAIAAHHRLAAPFAPHETYEGSPPALGMKVTIDPGALFDGAALTELGAQTTTDLAAPTSGNSRVDRIVGSKADGTILVVAGTPAGSPSAVAPAIPSGYFPIAQVHLETSQTAITNQDITDERAIPQAVPDGATITEPTLHDPTEEVEYYDPSTSPPTLTYVPLKKRIVPIGAWNMDSTASVNVDTGVIGRKIRALHVTILNDGDTTRWHGAPNIHDQGGAIIFWAANDGDASNTILTLTRTSAEDFDSNAYDDGTINRGFITIEYDATP